MVILRALYNIDRKSLALKGKYGYGNPTNDDVINKGNFKEQFNVMSESNDCFHKLFEKRKKKKKKKKENATLKLKAI